MSAKLTVIPPYQKFIEMQPGYKGLIIDEKIPLESYIEAVRVYGALAADSLWALGDLFVFGERVFGEQSAQAIEDMKYSEKTMKDATWVCSVFPSSRRHKELTFNHHKIVAGLDLEDREALLSEAEKKSLTTRQLTDLKKEKFPKPKKASSKKKKDKASDEPPAPKEEKAVRVTHGEFLEALNVAISFLEQQDKKVTFTKETTVIFQEKLKVLRRNARRLNLMGSN